MITQPDQQEQNCDFAMLVSSFYLSIFFLCSTFFCLNAHAADFIITAVELNTEAKADVFAFLQEDGDFLLTAVDLMAMGIQRIDAPLIVIDEEEYVSLRSMEGVDFVFQEATLTLELTVEPELLPVSVIDMLPLQKKQVYFPREDSLFFNYGLDFEGGTEYGNSFRRQSFTILNELGIRRKDILFFTDTLYKETPSDNRFARLNTNVTYDQRDKLQRFVVGDTVAFSGDLGSRVQFAGISVSKSYQIDPYFIEYPFYNFSGVLPLPSEVVIYSNGARLHKEDLPPGRFDLKNFHNTGGAQDIVLEITDALGRVQRITSPFYFSNRMLRKGLSEYSYNLGTLRRSYGLEDDRYSHAVFSARHRYGFSDEFNLGFRSEAGNSLFNLGIEALYRIKNYGVVGLDISGSGDDDGSGWASLLRYEYRNRRFNTHFSWTSFSDEYQTFERQEFGANRTSIARFGIGYSGLNFGSVSLGLSQTKYKLGSDESSVLVSYSKRINRRISLSSNVRYTENEEPETEGYLSLSYYFDNDHTATSAIRQGDDRNTQTLEARSNMPVGEGGGWWSLLEREDNGSSDVYTFKPGGQWNTSYGTYRGEVDLNSDYERLHLTAAGSIVSLAGIYGLTRPVTDSFGLVKVNDLEGVRIYANGQEVGKTNAQGNLFTPNLTSFYHNRISIGDEDIPIDYLMPQVEKNISPPYRSGSCLSFPVEKYQAFTAKLTGTIGGETRPLEFYDGEFFGGMRTIKFFTGSGGEFYFDNDPGSVEDLVTDSAEEGCGALGAISTAAFSPGMYGGQAISEAGEICQFELQLPETDERYFELGEIICFPGSEIATPPGSSFPAEKKSKENSVQLSEEKTVAE